MISSGALEIVLKLKDPADYGEFVAACKQSGIRPLPIGHYAQKLGMVLVAMIRFPGVAVDQAYLKLIDEMNAVAVIAAGQPVPATPCGGCSKQPTDLDNGGPVL